jgi:hypothetical protein
MDRKESQDFRNQELTNYIPVIGEHLESWNGVKSANDATIIKLAGLSNITCLVKARDK